MTSMEACGNFGLEEGAAKCKQYKNRVEEKKYREEYTGRSIFHRRPLEIIHNADQAEMQSKCGQKSPQ
jgi:hypothetical protein